MSLPSPYDAHVLDVAADDPLLVAGVPRSARVLACRRCGLAVHAHGINPLHEFVRPGLPQGYRYADEVRVGDRVVLRREPSHDITVVVTHLSRVDGRNGAGLLWLRSARRDRYLLHPATIVVDAVHD